MAAVGGGTYPFQEWRESMRQATYRGVPFYVQSNAKRSGRRTSTHEMPKSDIPYSEDMGRRLYRFVVTAYIIGPFFFSGTFAGDRDNLENALEDSGSQGPGILILPTRRRTGNFSNLFTVPEYTTAEREVWGGYAEFEILFQEYGTPALGGASVVNSQGILSASSLAAQSAVQFFNSQTASPPGLNRQVGQ